MNKLYFLIPILFGLFFVMGSIVPWLVSMPDSLMVFAGFVTFVVCAALVFAIVHHCWGEIENVMKVEDKNEEN